MNKTIRALNKELLMAEEHVEEINTALQEAYNEVFEVNGALMDAIVKLESSQEFRLNSFGEIESVLDFNLAEFKDCKKYLTEYLKEFHFVRLGGFDGKLAYSQGPSIIINEDGDIFDQESDETIAKHIEYKDFDGTYDMEKRNQLVEAYMEKRGYFPGVFRVDHYGNVYAVDTKVEV